MIRSTKTLRVGAALLAAFLMSSACGGGGGGTSSSGGSTGSGSGSPPPPPPSPPPPSAPPPPPSAAVTANATASAASVQEGQPFSVDASASTSNSGLSLTYAWTQVSGPAVTIANPSMAKLDLEAAEVAGDSPAQFKVTVSSGSLSSEATVDVTFSNIVQTPVLQAFSLAASAAFNTTFSSAIEAMLGDWSFGLVGTTTVSGGPITFTEFAQTGAQVIVSPVSPFTQTFAQPATFSVAPTPLGVTFDVTAPYFAASEETANRFRIFRRSPSGGYSTVFMDRAITRPCAVHYWFNPPASSQSRVLVGQRTLGFSIIAMDAAGTLYQEINTGHSLCALAVAKKPLNASDFAGPRPPMEDIIAVDTENNTISRFGSDPANPTQYELKGQPVALQLDSSSPLQFVAATPVGLNGVAGLALVYSDGQHLGQHRLVVVGLHGLDRSIVQRTRSWPLGAPSHVIQDDLDGDGFPEIVVISPTSPQAIVYPTSGSSGVSIPSSVAATPSFIEIGLGATKALPKNANVLDAGGFYVAYRDLNLIRLYVP